MDQVDRFFDDAVDCGTAKNGMKFKNDVANEKLDTWKLSSSLFSIFLGRRLPISSREQNIVAIYSIRRNIPHILGKKKKKKKGRKTIFGSDIVILFFQQKLSVQLLQIILKFTTYYICSRELYDIR